MISDAYLKGVDGDNMLGTVNELAGQIDVVWNDHLFSDLDSKNFNFNKVVIIGMGSSLIAFKLLSSAFENNFSFPIFIANKENLPSWIDEKTLVIVSSYSGNSIETLTCTRQALKNNCQVVAIFSGGKLEKIRNKFDFSYKFQPKLNFCQQPRLAIGYSLASYLMVLKKLNIIDHKIKLDQQVSQAILTLKKSAKSKSFHTQAIKLAKFIDSGVVEIIGTGFLAANAELMSKQISWNGKRKSSFDLIPEAMHVVTEGMSDQQFNKMRRAIFLNSGILSKMDQKLIKILRDFYRKHKIKNQQIIFENSGALESILNTALFSSYVSFYIAIINQQNPSPTPGIDSYKEKLHA